MSQVTKFRIHRYGNDVCLDFETVDDEGTQTLYLSEQAARQLCHHLDTYTTDIAINKDADSCLGTTHYPNDKETNQ